MSRNHSLPGGKRDVISLLISCPMKYKMLHQECKNSHAIHPHTVLKKKILLLEKNKFQLN